MQSWFPPGGFLPGKLPMYELLMWFVGEQRGRDAEPFIRQPDLVIAPDGVPYLYRWHLIPRNASANVYFHIQVADDPERPLHDHEYDNQSVILAGGYKETYWRHPHAEATPRLETRIVRAGRVVHRRAEEAHRLSLLPGEPYAITLFTTGPRIRDWGFWLPSGWVKWDQVTEGDYRTGGVSKWKDAI